MRWPYLLLLLAPFLESYEAVVYLGVAVGSLLMIMEHMEDKEK